MQLAVGHKRPDRTEVDGLLLAAALELTGVSAAELSRRLEIDDSSIYRWKSGRAPMQIVYWLAATQALGLPADWRPEGYVPSDRDDDDDAGADGDS